MPARQAEQGSGSARPVRIGVSACLLGQKVRYDGGHKRASFVADVLPRYVELIPLCPEVAIGLGVPREPIRLEGIPEAPRAVGVSNRQLDVTDRLQDYGREVAGGFGDISGYIFKSKSPSCGLENVRLHTADGGAIAAGTGLYAAEIVRAMPLLPVVEESRLEDPEDRENFMERVFAYHRWQELLREGPTVERLARFHAAHKMILLAHSREHLTRLGRLVAAAGQQPLAEQVRVYGELLMQALAQPATRQRHADALYHLMGYLKDQLDQADKAELVELIENYRTGLLPRIAPIILLRHHFRRHPQPYVEQQLYLAEPQVF
jgi:uncharacterized protein YbgA (DUF1722 family)/uncharacterized protein YbbK (DUF523 family)